MTEPALNKMQILQQFNLNNGRRRAQLAGDAVKRALIEIQSAQDSYNVAHRELGAARGELKEAEAIATTDLWPTLDSADPQTGRSNKDWANTQLQAKLGGHPEVLRVREAIIRAEEIEITADQVLRDKERALKAAKIDYDLVMWELRTKTAQLSFLGGDGS